ncbi:MAG: hypothetical protein SWX82_22315 [Cyanobacteriota bacterium]|nr:hypothetical protein [Cyanobacteriota bacterium]
MVELLLIVTWQGSGVAFAQGVGWHSPKEWGGIRPRSGVAFAQGVGWHSPKEWGGIRPRSGGVLYHLSKTFLHFLE